MGTLLDWVHYVSIPPQPRMRNSALEMVRYVGKTEILDSLVLMAKALRNVSSRRNICDSL